MSILASNNSGWIISHADFFKDLRITFNGADDGPPGKHDIRQLNPKLFQIDSPFQDSSTSSKKRKRRRAPGDHYDYESGSGGEIEPSGSMRSNPTPFDLIESLFGPLQDLGRAKGIWTNPQSSNIKQSKKETGNNAVARGAANDLFEKFKSFEFPVFKAHANTLGWTQSFFRGQYFLYPPRCTFYCQDVKTIGEEFKDDMVVGNLVTFDLIVLDPPWKNRFVRRRKRKQAEACYKFMDVNELGNLPIKDLTSKDGLVVIWVTNSPSLIRAVETELFSKWELEYLGRWFWVKVTTAGELVSPLNEPGKKQPYESILIGRKPSEPSESTSEPATSEARENLNANPGLQQSALNSKLTSTQLIVSVPSSIHSHKPPLYEILKQFFPRGSRKLEIFARSLHDGVTSFGNEVIKLQHESLFVPQTNLMNS